MHLRGVQVIWNSINNNIAFTRERVGLEFGKKCGRIWELKEGLNLEIECIEL